MKYSKVTPRLFCTLALLCLVPAAQAQITPGKLLIYYGFPSLVNTPPPISIAEAAAEFGQYDYVVFGDCLEFNGRLYTTPANGLDCSGATNGNPYTHPDHANLVAILAHPNMAATTTFGYVDLGVNLPTQNLPITEIVARVDDWIATGVDGIFLDDYSFDWGVDRARQQAAVDSIHARGLPVVANGFFIRDTFGTVGGVPTPLNSGDYYLYESFQIKKGLFDTEAAWQAKSDSLKTVQDTLGAKTLSITTNDVANTYDQEKFFYAWYSALLYGHTATGWGEGAGCDFSACDNAAPFRTRPAVNPGTAYTTDVFLDGPRHLRDTDKPAQVCVDPTNNHRYGLVEQGVTGTFYVSPTGSDCNTGTGLSDTEAWRTIQHAMNTVGAGSTVNVLAGTYQEKVAVNVTGTAGNPIILQNYLNDVAILDGNADQIPGDAMIEIIDKSYITIQGLRITNNQQNGAFGILVGGDAQNIEIRNNEIDRINWTLITPPAVPFPPDTVNSQPIVVFGNAATPISGLVIDGNEIHTSQPGRSEALAVNGNIDGFSITNNIVRDIANICIDVIGGEADISVLQARNGTVKGNTVFNCISPYATAAGIYVDGGMDVTVENNVVYQNQWGIEVGAENPGISASNVKVRNNQIYNNEDSCLSIGGFDFPASSGKVANCLITNNSCLNNDTVVTPADLINGELNISYVEGCTIENNIFYANNDTASPMVFVDAVGSSGLAMDYNLYYTQTGSTGFDYQGTFYPDLATYQAGTLQDANSVFGDPLFVSNALVPDLHLSSNASPAVNAGNPAFTPAPGETDMDGETRVVGGRVDIGADERAAALPVVYLVPLNATYSDGTVRLTWSTASEIDTDYFEIERSEDEAAWTVVGAEVSNNAPSAYEVYDSEPIGGLAFYRLKQIDLDGSFEYSHTVEVYVPEDAVGLYVYPNPARGTFAIRNLPNTASVEIFDALGRRVYAVEDPGTETIEPGTLSRGHYFIKIQLPERTLIKRLVIH